jgi:dTDP-glucose 4,6-dehydratase
MVIGANSFSGQDFVDLILDNPDYQVLGVSRSPERSALFLKYKLRRDLSRYRYFQIDLNKNIARLLDLLDKEQPAYIVNFAAQSEVAPSWDQPEHWFETNCVALARLVNHLRQQAYLQKYLHISSPEVYGTCIGTVKEDAVMNPSTPYAASKAAADFLLSTYWKQFKFPLLMVRSTNVYGARQQLFKIIPRSVIYLRMNKLIGLHGGGKAVKSYIHIRDISAGELAILDKGRLGELYHLSPDKGIAVHDLVQLISNRMGKDFAEVTKMIAERPGQDAAYVIDSAKARQELGWLPKVKIEEGINEVVNWVEQYWQEIKDQPLTYLHRA